MLRKNFFSAEELVAIVKDFRNAGLTPQEVAIMSLAQKVAAEARQTNESDFDALRAYGLSDEEILDVVLAAAARCFFSKTLDAVSAAPDSVYLELEPELRQWLTTGRPFP